MKPQPPDDLRRLLREWHETPAADPMLASRVSLEAKRRAANRSGWRSRVLGVGGATDWFQLSFRAAIACFVLGGAIGIGLAEWRATRLTARLERNAPRYYLEMIDPAMASPNRGGRR